MSAEKNLATRMRVPLASLVGPGQVEPTRIDPFRDAEPP
jgi:hypothetical protein